MTAGLDCTATLPHPTPCRKGGQPHFLVSAKTGAGVDDAFLALVKAAAARVKLDVPLVPETLKLDAKTPRKGDKCAC